MQCLVIVLAGAQLVHVSKYKIYVDTLKQHLPTLASYKEGAWHVLYQNKEWILKNPHKIAIFTDEDGKPQSDIRPQVCKNWLTKNNKKDLSDRDGFILYMNSILAGESPE